VLWCYEQQRIGRRDFRLELDDALRHFAFEVLVTEGQIVDRDEEEGQLFPSTRSLRRSPKEEFLCKARQWLLPAARQELARLPRSGLRNWAPGSF
jgi:hypothetical protein